MMKEAMMKIRACTMIAFAAFMCDLITPTTAQTPQLQLTGGTLSTVNLYSSPPANGTFLSGAGSAFQICTSVACLTDGHLHSGNYFTNATTFDADYGEYTVSFNTTINTGLAPSWIALNAYTLNYEIINASDIYKVTTAGTSSTASPPTGTGSSIPDGTVIWAFVGPSSDNQGKVGLFNSTLANPGAGGSWGLANDFVLGSGAYIGAGAFYASSEFDFGNNAGDCVVGVSNCYGMFLFGNTNFPITAEVAISTPASTPTYAAHYGILFNGTNTIKDAGIEDNSSAAIGLEFGGISAQSHSTATIRDLSTSPISFNIQGTHSAAAFVDQSTSPNSIWILGTHSGSGIFENSTASIGIFLGGTYSTSQISGTGWSVSPTGAVTTSMLQTTSIVSVIALPACNSAAEGTWAGVNDALAPAFNTQLVGGGSVHIHAYCNGTNWIP
jgi:hypothetical protein